MKKSKKIKKKKFRFKKLSKQYKDQFSLAVLVLFGAIVFFIAGSHLSSQKVKELSKNPINPSPAPTKEVPRTPIPVKDLRIPILMFHHVRDPRPFSNMIQRNLSVSPGKFRSDLDWLKNNGYQVISMDDLEAVLTGQMVVTKKPVILTFDDGYEDNYKEAFPDLKARSMTGTFYIITDFVNHSGFMTKSEIKEMSQANMNIGSHTKIHVDLARVSEDRQTKELSGSKTFLTETLGKEIDDFCYPSGRYNQSTINILRNLEYKTATTTKFGFAVPGVNFLQLPRVRMNESTDLNRILH